MAHVETKEDPYHLCLRLSETFLRAQHGDKQINSNRSDIGRGACAWQKPSTNEVKINVDSADQKFDWLSCER